MSVDPNFNKLTYQQYVLFPPDGKRHEIVDGDHFMNPAPDLSHQTISRRILHQLYTQIELNDLGWVFDAPCDVQLTKFDVVQPDLVVVLKKNEKVLTKAKIDGVPDLVIEILSPSNADYDRDLKMKLYQRTGVPEYWIVDPMGQCVTQYVLTNKKFEIRENRSHRIELAILDSVSLETTGLFDKIG